LRPESTRVCADPHQLEQVVMNLAVNARDAMPEGGRLTIGTELREPDAGRGRPVVLTVRDTGTGMDEATSKRIFEPFFTTKESGRGTGLGLSMVQGIVEQSGGQIEIETGLGRGTTFRICLPSWERPAEPVNSPSAEVRTGATILVVDDQDDVRAYAVAALKAHGYEVLQAAGADEALEIFGREGGRIRLVLTDVVMPGSSGGELVAQWEKLRPGMPILFMSGYSDMPPGEAADTRRYLQKPFGAEELAGKVRMALEPVRPKPAKREPGQVLARILVADDEAGVRAFLTAVLEQAG
jgi:CheY-like chemotaxis protein